MNLYQVTGHVSGRGKTSHVVKAASETEAWERFLRTWSKHDCRYEGSRELRAPETEPEGETMAEMRERRRTEVVAHLRDHGDATAQDVAKALGATSPVIGGMMRGLQASGLVEKAGEFQGVAIWRAVGEGEG